ncbi:hypothetical protein MACK_003886 [Theileria orientalis]|uniref:Uncharacterized protein n=1 Tax=Theileria orientalis TaxID=68886 RepID=A0A976SJ29_THEOR|nr:hypothetical protein MACK_003886 [Theileria orientalis]
MFVVNKEDSHAERTKASLRNKVKLFLFVIVLSKVSVLLVKYLGQPSGNSNGSPSSSS